MIKSVFLLLIYRAMLKRGHKTINLEGPTRLWLLVEFLSYFQSYLIYAQLLIFIKSTSISLFFSPCSNGKNNLAIKLHFLL
jgi:hypothetical protein